MRRGCRIDGANNNCTNHVHTFCWQRAHWDIGEWEYDPRWQVGSPGSNWVIGCAWSGGNFSIPLCSNSTGGWDRRLGSYRNLMYVYTVFRVPASIMKEARGEILLSKAPWAKRVCLQIQNRQLSWWYSLICRLHQRTEGLFICCVHRSYEWHGKMMWAIRSITMCKVCPRILNVLKCDKLSCANLTIVYCYSRPPVNCR